MNTVINVSKDLFTILKNGIIIILAFYLALFCFGLVFHAVFIFVGIADVMMKHYYWTHGEASAIILIPLLWLGMCLAMLSSKTIQQKSINIFLLSSAALVIFMHILLFTTHIGSLYLRMLF